MPGVSLRPPLAFNPRPRRLSTPPDAFELHPDIIFKADGKIEDGCEATYELLRTAAPWVDAALRWTTEEAVEELTAFRGDHGLVIDVSAVQERRCSTLHAARPAPPPREELPSASIDQGRDGRAGDDDALGSGSPRSRSEGGARALGSSRRRPDGA